MSGNISDHLNEYSKRGLKFIDNTASSTLKIGEMTITEFGKFLAQKDILDMAIGITIGTYLTKFATEIISILGKPIIDKLIGTSKLGERYKYRILGMDFDLGRMIELLLNLILTLFLMFLLFKYLPKLVISKQITK